MLLQTRMTAFEEQLFSIQWKNIDTKAIKFQEGHKSTLILLKFPNKHHNLLSWGGGQDFSESQFIFNVFPTRKAIIWLQKSNNVQQ